MDFHAIADEWPLMEGEDFRSLVESVRRYGVKVPCWKYEGKILDGRNRYRAAQEADVAVEQWHEFHGTEDEARALARLLNDERRHLTPDDRRKWVHKLREQGLSTRAIAEQVGVSHMTVKRDIAGVTGVTPAHTDERPIVTAADAPKVCTSETAVPVSVSVEPTEVREATTPEPASKPEPKKVTGTDGKKYPAKRPEKKPASKPEPAANVDAAWSEFESRLTAVVDSVLALSPKTLPEGVQRWQIYRFLEEASQKIMAAATRFAPSR